MNGRFVGSLRYLALIGVAFTALASACAFVWGAWKTIALVARMVRGESAGVAIELIRVMDGFLIAAGLLIFALGLYELFIGPLQLPEWLVINDLDSLKSKLATIIVLVMAVAFLENVEHGAPGQEIFFTGAGIALVGAILIFYARGKAH